MHKILLFLSFLLLIKDCNSKQLTELEGQLQETIDQIVKDESIPGISVGIVLPNNEVLKIAAGYSDKEMGRLLTTQDLMFSGSVGKTYLVPMILQLVEAGKLALEDQVQEYFKAEDWFSQIPNATDITVEMLLNHTSGIPRYVFKPALWEKIKEQPNKAWTGKERLSYIFNDPPLHKAGQDWKYSDTNYILLGMIIEKIRGKTYFDLLETEILQPLKLNHTKPSRQPYIAGLAGGYTAHSQTFSLPTKMTTNHRYAINPQMEWTGGGVASTAADLAKWAKYHYSGKLLSKNQLRHMTAPGPHKAELPNDAQYGLGTFIWENEGIKSYGHTGFMFGYLALMEYIPEYDIALAIQVNTDQLPEGESLYTYRSRIKEILLSTRVLK